MGGGTGAPATLPWTGRAPRRGCGPGPSRRLASTGSTKLTVPQQRPERGAALERRPQLGHADAPGGALHLDQGLDAGAVGAEEDGQADQALAADDADLLEVAVLQGGEHRDHAALEKVDGPDRLAGLVQGLLEVQADGPEGGRQDGEVVGRQGGEEPVADGGLLLELGHAPPRSGGSAPISQPLAAVGGRAIVWTWG